jgi:imidazolonepropionase-like amidohydrolase
MTSSASTLFINVNILDGSGAAPFPGAVLVKGNRIEAVIPQRESTGSEGERIATDAVVIDGKGATLMPGLIEPHAHLSFSNMSSSVQLGEIAPEEHTLITAKHARVMLDHGFTACVSAASAKPRLDIAVRDWINAGEIPGPRLLAASPEMTVTGGLGDPSFLHLRRENFGWVCNGADEFRASARLMCREGVDTLKINISGDDAVPAAKATDTVMNDSEVEAVCEVARGRGKRVAAHVRSAESVKMALRHGVEILYHATLVDDDACAMLEEHRERVFVAPTLGNLYSTLYEASPWGLTTELATARGAKRELTLGIDNMKALRRRGVRILPGGDYGFAWAPIGANARDIEHFVNLLGLSATEAIQAATQLGGEIMMMGAELGRIEAGYLADLLLVDGDPVQDVSILQRTDKLLAIMKDGRFHKSP